LLEEAIRAVRDDRADRARLLARLSGALRGDRRHEERRAVLTQEALEIARRLGDDSTLAYVLETTTVGNPHPDETLATGSELLAIAERIGDQERTVLARVFRFVGSVGLGDLVAAEAELEQMSDAADRLRQPAQLAYVLVARAMLAMLSGKFEQAEALMENALEVGRHAHPWIEIYVRLQRCVLRREQGQLDALEEIVKRSIQEPGSYPIWPCVLADLYVKLGRDREAREVFEALARDKFASLAVDEEWMLGIALLAEVCGALGDADRARQLYALLGPRTGQNVYGAPEASLGAVDRYLGILATTLGRWEEAARHYVVALDENERMGARPWLAHTRCDYARMLLARDEPGDREHAQELLDRALTTYRELGMQSYAAPAGALAQEFTGTV
jgi:tetratricopeptide (TPR) repeat protein